MPFDLIALKTSGDKTNQEAPRYAVLLQHSIISSQIWPMFFEYPHFFFPRCGDQISHPYVTTGNMIVVVIYVLCLQEEPGWLSRLAAVYGIEDLGFCFLLKYPAVTAIYAYMKWTEHLYLYLLRLFV
jgi:hypothetical protein